ncbi:MAG: hypothetical protein A2Z96_04230 [Spirochaetes bacterium GWB1_48_6]|nr:MAG: hypothetical protein A2Z96_04230 [Spirochaetes bacterium GWB1_48_6]
MRVHNLVKDLVVQKVEEMFSKKDELQEKDLGLTQDCMQDVVCYVLNRTQPEYVVSGRGMAHSESSDYNKKLQRLADIIRLIQEGMEAVSKRRRPRDGETEVGNMQGSFFNFPSIIGRLFNGENFSPISDVKVYLLENGVPVPVIDPNWQNPYMMVINTAGTYLFWPHPLRAEGEGIERTFAMEISVDDPLYESLRIPFEFTITSQNRFVDFVNSSDSFRIKDQYLFPRE